MTEEKPVVAYLMSLTQQSLGGIEENHILGLK
jgi:hypothetical protein